MNRLLWILIVAKSGGKWRVGKNRGSSVHCVHCSAGTSFGRGQGGGFALHLILKNSDFLCFCLQNFVFFIFCPPPRKSVKIPPPPKKLKWRPCCSVWTVYMVSHLMERTIPYNSIWVLLWNNSDRKKMFTNVRDKTKLEHQS